MLKIAFGFLGAAAYSHDANLFDGLFFSERTPSYVNLTSFIYTSNPISSF